MLKDILRMDNVRIIHRNFAGRRSQYNREGDRNFSVVIEDSRVAQQLAEVGWNIKIKPPREDGDSPLRYLPVKIKYNQDYPRSNPVVYLRSGKNMRKLDEDSLDVLDTVDIINVDLDIRPYNYNVQGKTGVTAYLTSMCITQNVDRFMQKYAEEEYPSE